MTALGLAGIVIGVAGLTSMVFGFALGLREFLRVGRPSSSGARLFLGGMGLASLGIAAFLLSLQIDVTTVLAVLLTAQGAAMLLFVRRIRY